MKRLRKRISGSLVGRRKTNAAVQIFHQSVIVSRTYQTIPNNQILATICAILIFCGVHCVCFLPCFATSLLNEGKTRSPRNQNSLSDPRPMHPFQMKRYCHVLAVGILHDHQQVGVVCHFGRSLHWLDVGQHVIFGSAYEGHSDGIPWFWANHSCCPLWSWRWFTMTQGEDPNQFSDQYIYIYTVYTIQITHITKIWCTWPVCHLSSYIQCPINWNTPAFYNSMPSINIIPRNFPLAGPFWAHLSTSKHGTYREILVGGFNPFEKS